MSQGFTTVPFKAESGMSTINGVAKFSSAGIIIEFESKLLGLVSSGLKEVRLPIDELLDVKFKKGLFKRGAKIELRLKSFAQYNELPRSEGKVVLKLFPDDVGRAGEATERLIKEMAAQEESLPPPHQPVRSLFDESENDTKELDQ